MAKAAGVSRTTVYAGLAEIEAAGKASKRSKAATPPLVPSKRVRARGGGRKRLIVVDLAHAAPEAAHQVARHANCSLTDVVSSASRVVLLHVQR